MLPDAVSLTRASCSEDLSKNYRPSAYSHHTLLCNHHLEQGFPLSIEFLGTAYRGHISNQIDELSIDESFQITLLWLT